MGRAESKKTKDSLRSKQRKIEYDLRHQQVATVKKYVYQTAFRDRIIKEIVCTQTPSQINSFLKATLTVDTPQVYFPMNEGYTDGLVLVNPLTFEFTFPR